MSLASVGAAVLGEYDEAVAVMLLYQIGELLQQAAVENSRRSITEIVKLRSEKATLIADHKQKTVKPEELRPDDLIMVRPGDKFPVDGIIERGSTSVDTKNLTGEPIPVDMSKGDQVLSGTVNVGKAVVVRVLRPYEDSAVARVLDMVENSGASKAEPEKFITRFARVYTPIVCLLAVIAAFGIPTVIGICGGGWPFAEWVRKALVFLVVSCPCALVISVPLTYFSGIGCAAKNGILVKGATFLDTAAKVKTAVFDKTGTLTKAEFEISHVEAEDEKLVLNTLAAIERFSAHPIAAPFARLQTPFEAAEVKEMPGMGIVCEIDGKQALAGNKRLMEKYGVDVPEPEQGAAAIYTVLDGRYLGYAAVDDVVKAEAAEAMTELKKLGVDMTVMLTGDREERGEQIAALVGIDSVKGGLLPEGKLEACRELKDLGPVLYTGDGINDAPVMAEADVSVSMGKLGSGAAIEASDVVLVSDSLTGVPKLIKLARKVRKIVMENIVFSIAIKVIIMAVGVFVLFPLWYAVLADVGVMLLAVANSLRTKLIRL
ncbi:MAG: cadmium-translocating P-type ATPase [Oscillospiraceae bacterium]|nr:cadmium-translocating P-type ATPase [Oscillospiraceae bacterium]